MFQGSGKKRILCIEGLTSLRICYAISNVKYYRKIWFWSDILFTIKQYKEIVNLTKYVSVVWLFGWMNTAEFRSFTACFTKKKETKIFDTNIKFELKYNKVKTSP